MTAPVAVPAGTQVVPCTAGQVRAGDWLNVDGFWLRIIATVPHGQLVDLHTREPGPLTYERGDPVLVARAVAHCGGQP